MTLQWEDQHLQTFITAEIYLQPYEQTAISTALQSSKI